MLFVTGFHITLYTKTKTYAMKFFALLELQNLVSAYFPRAVMPPDVNQIMRTHIAVSCQISINAGRGRDRIGQQLYLLDSSSEPKPEFNIILMSKK